MRFSRAFIFSDTAFVGGLRVLAQDDDVIKIDSSIVRLNVGVVDQKGRPITTLDKDSFTLFEDGVKQEISRFEPTMRRSAW